MYSPCTTRLGLILAIGAVLSISAPARAAEVKLPDGGIVKKVDFERHIMGLLGKAGCNGGGCHGSFQGKGGLRLSLFGYDPEKDYFALSRDAQGRRIDTTSPDGSLALLKATGQVKHDGLTRFGKDSWSYQLFREWIQQGAQWNKGSGDIVSVTINPPEYAFSKPNEKGQLTVQAAFADGTKEIITSLCDFRVLDDAVADVNALGQIQSKQPGDTAVIVSYRGTVRPVRIMVPAVLPPGFKYPVTPAVNYIDTEVFTKLRRLNMAPSDLSSDAEFLRRVTIDTIGTVPSPKEVRDFLADKSPDKRTKKVDELLAHPMHAALWATKFCDITGNNTDSLENPQQMRPKLSQMWHDWFRKRVFENMPYDEIVKGVLTATTRDGKSPEDWLKDNRSVYEASMKGFTTPYAEKASLDLFWRRQAVVPPDQWGQKTAAAFLGVRLECAECHKHPFDRWTQVDYRAYGNIFGYVTVGVQPDATKPVQAELAERNKDLKNKNQGSIIREVFNSGAVRGVLPHPETNASLSPKALGGPVLKTGSKVDPRVELFDWMRSPENAFFARSFANRIWGHYFGRGIVEPVDDFSLANPPANEKLLDALAKDFIASKFDIRRLERNILLSRTYQLTSTTNTTNKFDKINHAHAYVRPMMAEVVVDVLNGSLGVTENFGIEAPTGCRAIEIGSSRLQNQTVGYVFRIFGRPPRSTACDCERAMEPGLPQKLFLMADQTIVKRISDAQQKLLKPLLSSKMTDAEILDELVLATLSRPATAEERTFFAKHLERRKMDRTVAFTDMLWVLINTTEFISNH